MPKALMAVPSAAVQIIGKMSAPRRVVTGIRGSTEGEETELTLTGVEDREIREEPGEGIVGVEEFQLGVILGAMS